MTKTLIYIKCPGGCSPHRLFLFPRFVGHILMIGHWYHGGGTPGRRGCFGECHGGHYDIGNMNDSTLSKADDGGRLDQQVRELMACESGRLEKP